MICFRIAFTGEACKVVLRQCVPLCTLYCSIMPTITATKQTATAATITIEANFVCSTKLNKKK